MNFKISSSSKFFSAVMVSASMFCGTQEVNAGLVNTTLRGGINIFAPSIAGSTVAAGKNIIGGVGVEVGVGPASVIADVLYAKRSIEIGTLSRELTYIHVPVQGQFSLGLFHVSGGLYWAQGMGSVVDSPGGSQTYAAANMSKADFGAVGGLGVGIPLGLASVSLDLRYNLGMKNVSTNALVESKNRSIDVMLGVSF